MKAKRGNYLIGIGILLLIMAFSLSIHNMAESEKVGKASERIAEELKKNLIQLEESHVGEIYKKYPKMEMPIKTIDENEYIGILRIPALGLELPVANNWSEEQLKYNVCRYYGSVYSEDMIIAGHNYRTHFSKIKTLSPGEEIFFVDVEGNLFCYEILEFEKLKGTDVAGIKEGSWDLTLFTCDYTGNNRVVVRCINKYNNL